MNLCNPYQTTSNLQFFHFRDTYNKAKTTGSQTFNRTDTEKFLKNKKIEYNNNKPLVVLPDVVSLNFADSWLCHEIYFSNKKSQKLKIALSTWIAKKLYFNFSTIFCYSLIIRNSKPKELRKLILIKRKY